MTTGSVSWRALGTTATLLVTRPECMVAARRAVENELAALDLACSRFRDDSALMRLNRAAGKPVVVDEVLYSAIAVALRAAKITSGVVDPTVGRAMDAIGYDRDFDLVAPDGPAVSGARAPGWRTVRVDPGRMTVELAPGTGLDLGATAKAWGADRAAARAAAVAPDLGVLVSLGGDIAIAGPSPEGGWAVGIADDHAAEAPDATVAVEGGGLATSSTTVRAWRRDGRRVHHIVDPATGLPARVVWRTASVTAATCVDANTSATAAIVLGEAAPAWLEERALPARLVSAEGEVVTVAGWPAEAVVA